MSRPGRDTLKVALVGPVGAGKTSIANFIGGQTDSVYQPEIYQPTAGVRIIECERHLPKRGGVPVELWDVSGNSSYEEGWGAIMQDMDGVALVYNPDKDGNDREIGDWYDYFVKNNDLQPSQTIAFAHRLEQRGLSRPPPKLTELKVVDTTFGAASTTVILQNFDDFLVRCLHARESMSRDPHNHK